MKVSIVFGKKRSVANFPLSFATMTVGQYLSAIRYRTGQCNAEVLLRSFMGMSKGHIPMWVQYELLPHIQFIEDLSEPLATFLVPSFCVRRGVTRHRYVAPASMLSGMSLQQFMSVDNFFNFYTSTQKEEFLHKFLACLYLRPRRSFFGKRLVDIEGEAAFLTRLDPVTSIAIYVNWILIKNWLSRTFKHLFAGGGEMAAGGKPKGTDWLEVFDSFVGDHVADMEAYQRMECMDAFRIMNNKIKESKKRERHG